MPSLIELQLQIKLTCNGKSLAINRLSQNSKILQKLCIALLLCYLDSHCLNHPRQNKINASDCLMSLVSALHAPPCLSLRCARPDCVRSCLAYVLYVYRLYRHDTHRNRWAGERNKIAGARLTHRHKDKSSSGTRTRAPRTTQKNMTLATVKTRPCKIHVCAKLCF